MTSVQPPAPPVPPAAQTAQPPVDGEVVDAQIVKLPDNLANLDRAITLKGEVITQNADGTVRIATPRGAIDIQLPAGQTVQKGDSVEIQIPPAAQIAKPVAVTLPQLPTLPQTTPPAAAPIPAPALPTPQVITDIVTQTPQAPAQTQQPQQPQTQNQGQVAGASPAATADTINPKGLMDFLRTTLQNTLKAPIAPEDAQPKTPIQTPFIQKPLALGQLARITPLLQGLPVLTPSAPQNAASPFINTQTTLQLATASPATGGLLSITMPNAQTQMPVQTQNPLLQASPASGFAPAVPATTLLPAAPLTIGTGLVPSGLNSAFITPDGAPLQQGSITIPTTSKNGILPLAADVRVTALLPTAALATVQNPVTATLLHASPTSAVLFATVKGETPQGLPVLELPTFTTAPDAAVKPNPAQMVLQFPAKGLTPSTILQLAVLPQSQNVTLGAPATAQLPSPAWDGLDDAIAILKSDPQGKQALPLLQAALPKPGAAGFTAPVLMLTAAMNRADITQWLGDKTTELLKVTKRGEALTRIAGDFATHAREAASDAPKGEWRSMALPMAFGQEVSRIMLHTRGFERDSETQAGKKVEGTRFIMDLSLTRMGPMQIDGFSVEKRLDITLRSEKNFSPAMREVMREGYANALHGIGFAGQLNFNAAPDHKGWVAF